MVQTFLWRLSSKKKIWKEKKKKKYRSCHFDELWIYLVWPIWGILEGLLMQDVNRTPVLRSNSQKLFTVIEKTNQLCQITFCYKLIKKQQLYVEQFKCLEVSVPECVHWMTRAWIPDNKERKIVFAKLNRCFGCLTT